MSEITIISKIVEEVRGEFKASAAPIFSRQQRNGFKGLPAGKLVVASEAAGLRDCLLGFEQAAREAAGTPDNSNPIGFRETLRIMWGSAECKYVKGIYIQSGVFDPSGQKAVMAVKTPEHSSEVIGAACYLVKTENHWQPAPTLTDSLDVAQRRFIRYMLQYGYIV